MCLKDQTKPNQKLTKHGVQFVLPSSSWAWSHPPWLLIHQWSDPEKETDSLTRRTCQLSLSPQLGDQEPLASFCASIWTSYTLCGTCAGSHNCSEVTSAATCNLQETLFGSGPVQPLALTIFLSLLPQCVWLSNPRILIFFIFISCKFLC